MPPKRVALRSRRSARWRPDSWSRTSAPGLGATTLKLAVERGGAVGADRLLPQRLALAACRCVGTSRARRGRDLAAPDSPACGSAPGEDCAARGSPEAADADGLDGAGVAGRSVTLGLTIIVAEEFSRLGRTGADVDGGLDRYSRAGRPHPVPRCVCSRGRGQSDVETSDRASSRVSIPRPDFTIFHPA